MTFYTRHLAECDWDAGNGCANDNFSTFHRPTQRELVEAMRARGWYQYKGRTICPHCLPLFLRSRTTI